MTLQNMTDEEWARVRVECFRFALRRTHDADDADDIVQDVIVRLLKGASSLTATDVCMRSYLRRCVLNAMIDRSRQHRHRTQHRSTQSGRTTSTETPEDVLDAAELERFLVREIARLPPRARTCFVEVELLGKSIDDVAADWAVSRKAVEMRLALARRHLRTSIST